MVQGALSSKAADPIRRELIARRITEESALRERFKRALKERDLPADANAADLARYIATVIYGMVVPSGTNRAELNRIIQTALRAWPK